MMKMKRLLTLGLSAVLSAALLAGCGAPAGGGTSSPSASPSTSPSASVSPSTSPSALSGVVNLDGSTSMEKVMGALAEAFMEGNGGVTVNYSGTGSSAGITAAKDGTADIGLSSRKLKTEEESGGLVGTTVALDGIAIIVNPANGVEDLTVEQVAKLATGEITNWKDVGGADAQVVMIGREAGSGTRDGFESITGTTDKCKYQNELTSTGDVIANVASNPNAIGYSSLSAVDQSVKALRIGGVVPSEDTVLDGTYTVQRDFVMVTKKDATLSPAAQAFFDFAMSEEAHAIIQAAGAVPLSK